MIKNPLFWLVALVGLVLDQITKYIVVYKFDAIGDTVPLLQGIFHFTYVTNDGAAFSLFPDGVVWLRWLSLFVSIGLIALGWFGSKMNINEQLGYGFILSGALGNGLCRFINGHVIDFLDFRLINFPVFNLADTFINVGIIFLLIATFSTEFTPRQRRR